MDIKKTKDKRHPQRALITGAGGFIGYTLFSRLQDICPLGVDFGLKTKSDSKSLIEIDLRDKEHVKFLFNKYSPDIVFHFAALSSPQRNEENVQLAEELHLQVTENILNNIHTDVHLIFLSTDKVFDGSEDYPDEESKTNPLWLYGELKLQCENMIRKYIKRFHILRLGIVHSLGDYNPLSTGSGPGSFIDKAIDEIKAGREVHAFDNVQRCYVKRDELIALLEKLIDDEHYGIYHVGSVMMSYYDRIRLLCEENQMHWQGQLFPKTGQALPMIQNLNTHKLKKIFGCVMT